MKYDRRSKEPQSHVRVRDALCAADKGRSSVLWVVIIRELRRGRKRKGSSFNQTYCHITQAVSLKRSMHLEVLALPLFLAWSCLCAPQQLCHPGDEFLGKGKQWPRSSLVTSQSEAEMQSSPGAKTGDTESLFHLGQWAILSVLYCYQHLNLCLEIIYYVLKKNK